MIAVVEMGGEVKSMAENRLRHAHFNSLNKYLLCACFVCSRHHSRYCGYNSKQDR